MEKTWREKRALTTEISVEPTRAACRPNEPVVLTLKTDATDDIKIVLGLPLDIRSDPDELVLRGGILKVELRAALPGRYTISLDSASGGLGQYVISTGDKFPHIFKKKPFPIAVLDVRWGEPRS